MASVRTTLDLPDELMRLVKMRALQENRKLEDVVADLLRRGLAPEPGRPAEVRRRVRVPLIECTHPAAAGEELTPEQVAEILLDEETPRDCV
jgi:plasmid stability protein